MKSSQNMLVPSTVRWWAGIGKDEIGGEIYQGKLYHNTTPIFGKKKFSVVNYFHYMIVP